MKQLFKIAAYCCGGIAGAAAGAWNAGWCSGMTLVMILLAMGICICVCLHEIAVIRHDEQEKARAAKRSAWRAAFIREMDKL